MFQTSQTDESYPFVLLTDVEQPTPDGDWCKGKLQMSKSVWKYYFTRKHTAENYYTHL